MLSPWSVTTLAFRATFCKYNLHLWQSHKDNTKLLYGQAKYKIVLVHCGQEVVKNSTPIHQGSIAREKFVVFKIILPTLYCRTTTFILNEKSKM